MELFARIIGAKAGHVPKALGSRPEVYKVLGACGAKDSKVHWMSPATSSLL